MKILSIDNMLEAALESGMPGYVQFVEQAELLATALGRNLAAHLNVDFLDAVWEGAEFGGLNARFGAAEEGAACPEVLQNGDPHGDWETLSPPAFEVDERRPGKLRLASDPA